MRVTAPRRNRGRFALAIVAALLVALLIGAVVTTPLPWHPPGRYADAESNRARQLREIALPFLPGACPPAPLPALRVVVTSTGIDLDHIAVVASWRQEDREAVLARLDEAWAEAVPFAWFGG